MGSKSTDELGDDFLRESSVESRKRRYYIISEGHTEEEYFRRLVSEKVHLRRENLIVDIHTKVGLDFNESGRIELIDLAQDEVEYTHGCMTLHKFVTFVFNDYINWRLSQISESNQYKERERLHNKFKTRRKYIMEPEHPDNEKYYRCLDDQNYVYDCCKLIDLLTEFIRHSEEQPDYSYEKLDEIYPIDGIPPADRPLEYDEIYFVFDRDYDVNVRDDAYYSKVINLCYQLRIHPIVTTPSFELWLWMHFENQSFEDKDYGFPDRSSDYMKRINDTLIKLEKEVSSLDEVRVNKHMDQDRFDHFYRYTIDVALANAQLPIFAQVESLDEPDELNQYPGTTVNRLVEEITDEDARRSLKSL